MLMPLQNLCEKYAFVPKGVIHVGAHEAEEKPAYDDVGVGRVVWIEANPALAEPLRARLSDEQTTVLSCLVSDVDDRQYDFKITNNSESSSLLELGTHKQKHPEVYVTETITLRSRTLASIIRDCDLDMCAFDFLNLDIQGAELLALRGLGEQIDNIDYIYTEVNTNHLYVDCALIGEIDEYLSTRGFLRVETEILVEYEWGDAFYIRSTNSSLHRES